MEILPQNSPYCRPQGVFALFSEPSVEIGPCTLETVSPIQKDRLVSVDSP